MVPNRTIAPVPVNGVTRRLPSRTDLQPAPAEVAGPQAPRSIWNSPLMQNVLPFLTSLSFHAVIIGVGLLTYKAIQIAVRPDLQDQVGVAITDTIQDRSGDSVKYQGPSDNGLERPLQAMERDVPEPGWAQRRGLGRAFEEAGGSNGDATVFALGPDSRIGDGHNGFGTHRGQGGTGTGDGGPLAAWGIPHIGGAPGDKGTGMFGGPLAHRVAYVCDGSGSMVNKLPSLKQELDRAVQGLKPVQSFSVIFFHEPGFQAISRSLLLATPENKRKAIMFVGDMAAGGSTDPIPGLELAFRQQPEVVFLLTDGDFNDNDAVLAKIRALNKDHRVRVNTIAFVSSSDTDTAFLDLLQRIAKENGGTYKHVSEDEL